MRVVLARVLCALIAAVALSGVALSTYLWTTTSPEAMVEFGGGHGDPAYFDNWFTRLTITYFYFTVLSNVVVGVTALLLAIRFDRTSTIFRVFWLFGLIGIIVTGLVVNLYLVHFYRPQGIHLVENDMVHVAVPILSTIAWLIFGPRYPLRYKYVFGATGVGVVWLIVTFIHGAFIHWYPYPFLDVDSIGLGKSLRNSVVILIGAFLMGLGILALNKVLPGHKEQDASPPRAEGVAAPD